MLYLAWTLRLAAAFVLLAAAAGKLRAGLATAAALVAEFGIAVLVCLPGTALLGCLAATVLFGVFSVGVAWLIAIGAGGSCHCFGTASDLGGRHVIRNVALVALAGGAAVVTALAPDGTPPPVALAVATACAAPVAAAFVRWDDLVILLAGLPEPASNEKGS